MNGGTIGLVDGVPEYVPSLDTTLDLNDPAFLEAVNYAAADGAIVIGSATLGGDEVRYLAVTVGVSGDEARGLFVSAISLADRLEGLADVMVIYAWVAVGVVIIVALVGWFVAGRLLSPVRELRATAARISAGALSERIPVSGNDDLSELTATINAMIGRLESAFTAQRRIINDVRHELATPLTIIRGHLELMNEEDPDDIAQTRDIVVDAWRRSSLRSRTSPTPSVRAPTTRNSPK